MIILLGYLLSRFLFSSLANTLRFLSLFHSFHSPALTRACRVFVPLDFNALIPELNVRRPLYTPRDRW